MDTADRQSDKTGIDHKVDLLLVQPYPMGVEGQVERLTLTAAIVDAPEVVATVTDEIQLGSVGIHAAQSLRGVAGDVVWFSHVVENRGTVGRSVDLAVSALGASE